MNTRLCLLASMALAAVFCATAQESTSVTSGNRFSGVMHFPAAHPSWPTTGAPYSAEMITDSDQALADGTHIRHSMANKIYRDSAGRTRDEWPVPPHGSAEGQEPLIMVQISDPVDHVSYTLDSINKVAHRQVLPASGTQSQSRALALPGVDIATTATGPSPSLVQSPGNKIKPEIVEEQLGTQMMEGVEVHGMRRTTTWPVGARGNDHQMIAVDETWRSPDLNVMVLHRRSDPLTGEITHRLSSINRSEPDAALFQPPPDYTVVDEAGDFTINWGP